MIDRWGHWQNLGLEAFFVGVSKHAEENKIYDVYIFRYSFGHIRDDKGIINQHKSTCICIK